jgi:hypothetical protein
MLQRLKTRLTLYWLNRQIKRHEREARRLYRAAERESDKATKIKLEVEKVNYG